MKPGKGRLDGIENPDVEISARVKSRALRFEEVPETATRVWADREHESVSGTERENLPDQVESGVTYRRSRVRLRIAGRIVDAGRNLEGEAEGG